MVKGKAQYRYPMTLQFSKVINAHNKNINYIKQFELRKFGILNTFSHISVIPTRHNSLRKKNYRLPRFSVTVFGPHGKSVSLTLDPCG